MTVAPPLPPEEFRALVGDPPLELWDNPTGAPIIEGLPPEAWRSYLDFGCGCGRSARRLLQQTPRPDRYLGIDLHRAMIEWCQTNLEPLAPGFRFEHHDVFNVWLNPDVTAPLARPLPVDDSSVSIVEAHSVFTHLSQGQAEHYLDEIARALTPDGWFVATWFLFDGSAFPYLPPGGGALYVNPVDPTYAAAFERQWFVEALAARGLVVVRAEPPAVRGYHWRILARPEQAGDASVELPPDAAPPGDVRRPRVAETGAELLAAQEQQLVPARELRDAVARVQELDAALKDARAALESQPTRAGSPRRFASLRRMLGR